MTCKMCNGGMFLGLVAAGALTASAISLSNTSVFAQTAAPAKAEPPAKDVKKEQKVATAKVGETAPDFTLTDTDGKTVSLAEWTKSGNTVVLEWFNPGCPFIVKHHEKNPTFANLSKEFKDKKVAFLAINTGASKADLAKAKKDWNIAYPVALDTDGKVSKMYGAKTTPHCFVIAADGKLVYSGAIDNDSDMAKAGDKNYVKAALDEILAGKKVTTAETKPYGCPVKYQN
ncbi:MAG: thioredoxin family protein [Phycisphaerae bacterium]|nr:thioredoxin family protein [Phycisphaerae bacterium]